MASAFGLHDDDARRCAICSLPVEIDGARAVYVGTAGQPWRWVHEHRCAETYAKIHTTPSTMPRERVLELFERARRAGRLR